MSNINRLLILVALMNGIEEAIDHVGGPVPAARICGVTRQAVDKWIRAGHLPRIEYTGETDYAAKLARASRGAFTAKQLRDIAAPAKNKPPH